MTDLEHKVKRAVRIIRSVNRVSDVIIAYSGGKDSDVIRILCKEAKVPYTLVYNNTTIDPPFTLSRNISLGAQIIQPKYTFLQLIERKGIPSLSRRFCCQELKEKYIAPRLLLGIRANESAKRTQRYTEPTACRIYTKNKRTDQILPILDWTEDDIFQFLSSSNETVHPLYYVNGQLDVTKRLGCIGCPLQGDRGLHDFLRYPKMLRQWCRAYTKYVEKHKAVEGIYEDIVYHIFYSNHGEKKYQQAFHGLFAPPNAKQLLEDYFHIEL